MDNQLVSVVIPTYKRPAYLERAINCITAQTYKNWELLVVDDNDEDSSFRQETEAFMRGYDQNLQIHYLKHKKNQGGAAARNTGIRNARGTYVAFLDDDDEWLPTKLEEQVACFDRASEKVAVVYTGVKAVRITGKGKKDGQVTLPTHKGNIFPALLKSNCVGTTSTIMCKTQALFEVGLFTESLPASQDWDLYIKLAEKYEFDYVSKPLVIFNKHTGERITKNFSGKVKAHDILYEKYKPLFQQNRKLHSLFLERQGKLLMRTNDKRRAKEKFAHALRVNPYNTKLLTKLLLVGLGVNHYHTIKDAGGSLQLLLRRASSKLRRNT